MDLLFAASGFDDIMAKANVIYWAPSDAAATGLPAGSVDIHLSYTVFEHIPGPVLEAILREANRLLSDSGLALHHIDPSDHFAQDGQITEINFLQYSQKEWDSYANNQFAYHNLRLSCVQAGWKLSRDQDWDKPPATSCYRLIQ